MDVLDLRVDTDELIEWRYRRVEMLVNGEPLLDIIRAAEMPYARREYDERVSSGESPDDLGDRDGLAGAYHYLPTSLVFPPSRNFFGDPYSHGFLVDDDDPVNSKSLILQCTCGIIDCWFLVADITVDTDSIIWASFQQFHREWTYEIPGFRFDRSQYETAFKRGTKK